MSKRSNGGASALPTGSLVKDPLDRNQLRLHLPARKRKDAAAEPFLADVSAIAAWILEAVVPETAADIKADLEKVEGAARQLRQALNALRLNSGAVMTIEGALGYLNQHEDEGAVLNRVADYVDRVVDASSFASDRIESDRNAPKDVERKLAFEIAAAYERHFGTAPVRGGLAPFIQHVGDQLELRIGRDVIQQAVEELHSSGRARN